MSDAPRSRGLALGAWPPRTGAFLLLATVLLAALFLSNAWVCDDAYITFRTLDNFVHGDGLVWNPGERVQSYTHPLWLFLHVPFSLATDKVFFVTVFLSLALSLAASLLALAGVSARSLAGGAVLVVALLGSKSFVDFTTSGLENPLTFLLLGVFAHLLLSGSGLFPPFLVAGLATLNRMDALLFFLPGCLLLAVRNPPRKVLGALLAGFLPFLAWELFSFFYYGFPFPNTRYAKLSTGLPWDAYAKQGWRYLEDLFVHDPAGAAILLSLPVVTVLGVGKALRRPTGGGVPLEMTALGAGGVLYGTYVVAIGGDFMSGRFWSGPVFLGAVLLSRHVAGWRGAAARPAIALLCAALIAGRLAARSPVDRPNALGIVDERASYAATNTLRANWSTDGIASQPWTVRGLQLRSLARETGGGRAVFISGIAVGMQGYHAGPRVTIIDYLGLCDPLLARLPVYDPSSWAPGHFVREVPTGYFLARSTGSLAGMDPDLAGYYDKLRLVVTGPLLSTERIRAAVELNAGVHDPLLEAYLRVKRIGPLSLSAFDARRPEGAPWNAAGTLLIPTRHEVVLTVDPPRTAATLELGANALNEYEVSLAAGGKVVGSVVALALGRGPANAVLRTRSVLLPSVALSLPIDTLVIHPFPRRPWTLLVHEQVAPWAPVSFSDYSIGYLRLR